MSAERLTKGGGIAAKWGTLNDEREALKEERDQLREQVRRLLAEQAAAENVAKFGFGPDESERDALDAIMYVYKRITLEWRLRANESELTQAVHVLQSFVVQHMLSRLAPEQWGSWWWKEGEAGAYEEIVRETSDDYKSHDSVE